MRWPPPGDDVHGPDKVTRVGDDLNSHLYPHKPPAAELGAVAGAGCLSAPITLAAAEQLFGGSPLSLMSSTLTIIKVTTDSEGRERGLNSVVCYQFFSVISIFLFRSLLCAMSSLLEYLQQSQF